MNWKHYVGIGVGFVATAFIVNAILDYFGVSKYVYQPYTTLFGKTPSS